MNTNNASVVELYNVHERVSDVIRRVVTSLGGSDIIRRVVTSLGG